MSMSLPTPPRTTHKNKENLPPTPFTPPTPTCRTPRIVWSRENLHHAYSTHVRQLPSSSRAKGPQKSILKKPSLPLMSLMPPEEPVREVTPEPADPLQHPLYLNSPVSTLIASLQPGSDAKITLSDLTEAYSVLSARLKAKMHTMVEMYGPIPALEPLREHRDELVKTFHRDIGRAFVNPQSSPPPSDDSPWSSPSSVGSIKKRGYTEQEVKHARDLCNLCHAAMRCFSNIALVPVLSSIFHDSQLGDMLTDVLAIPLASSLPTPNARKTCQIAVWTLQIQCLPTAVLEPAADRIAYALRRGVDGELGREGKKGSASDGLKAVATLASNQPAIFLRPFSEIIPSVFSHLTSQNLALRLQAAHAILSLSHALARLKSPPHALLESFRQATSTYLTDQQNMRKSPGDLSPLGKEFRACFEVETPMHSAQSPMWALSVIAAFIILSEGSAFTHSKTIKFVLGQLTTAMEAKRRTTVRATAGLVWRSLVWACLRLDGSTQTKEHKDAGWKVVRQILDGKIGISVVAALVGPKEKHEDRVVQALEAVRTMIKKGGRTCEEGVDVLERLLSAVGSGLEEDQPVWSSDKLLVEPLFDGTLMKAEWKGLVAHVKDALNQCVSVSDVTPLQETEVVRHWDLLFTIWKEAVEKAPLGEDGEIPAALLNGWQALLFTQAQLTRGFEHLTTSSAFIHRLTGLLTSFLNDSSLEWSLDAGSPSWSSQPLKLGFVRNLWRVARDIFAASILAGAAKTLLYEVLKNKYLLVQDEVRDAWAALCAELVLAGLPGLVRELWSNEHNRDDRSETEIKRGLWRVVSKRWAEDAGSWEGAIELLRAPFIPATNWTFDRDDLEIWVRVVDCALNIASARKISTVKVLDAIACEIGGGHNHVSLYAVLPYLLSGVDAPAPGHQDPPQHPLALLKLTNDVLVASYPPLDPGDRRMLLAVIGGLGEIIGTTHKDLLVDFLMCVQHGVKTWIADDKEVFTKEEYNEQIIPFYVDSLEALKKLPASLETLHMLCPLLISSFNRIPDPALGPSSFKTFWTEVYRPLVPLSTQLPEDLKPALRAVQDTMCTAEEEFAPGVSSETQTQRQGTMELPLSVIPDSLERDAQKNLAKERIEPEETPSPAMPTRTDDNQVPEPLKDHVPAAPHQRPTRDDKSQDNHTDASKNLVDDPSTLASDCHSDQPLHRVSVPEPPPLFIPPSADSGPSNIFSDGFHQSVGLGQSLLSPLSTLSDYDPFIVEDTKPLNPRVQTSSRRSLRSPRHIKEEYSDIDPDTAMVLNSSRALLSSQESKSTSSLGKRRRPRFSSHSNKRRQAAPGVGIEIISISDDEDSEQVALHVSVVARKGTKGLETRVLSQQTDQPVTPKSESQPSRMASSRSKRTFFEAVELPTLQGLLKQRNISSSTAPCQRDTQSPPHLWHNKSDDAAEQLPGPSKRRRLIDTSSKGKQKAVEDRTQDSPPRSAFYSPLGSLEICSDDPDLHLTPSRPSETSIPSSRPGQISAGHIVSPPCRPRSDPYDDIPSDDHMPSSPLKHAAARRIQRSRTVPVLSTNTHLERSETPTRPEMTRTHSEEFLALEHAHVVVSSGASRMRLQELVEANQMVSNLSMVLDDEMTKKVVIAEDQDLS